MAIVPPTGLVPPDYEAESLRKTAQFSKNKKLNLQERQQARFALYLVGVFLLIQILCQLALLLPQLQQARVVFRTAAFAGSLMAYFLLPGRPTSAPWRYWLLGAIIIYGLNFLHPEGNSYVARLASIFLNLAILAPAFWITRLVITRIVFTYLVGVLWLFATASATIGALQVIYPERFLGQISSNVESLGEYANGLKIVLADGTEIWRPTGLTDIPGGAAPSGLTAILFSLGLMTTSRNLVIKMACLGSIGIALFCIYICQVRVVLVISVIMFSVLVTGLFLLGRYQSVLALFLLVPGLVIGSFFFANEYGGESMMRRLSTLTESSAGDVYAKNRGMFLDQTIDEMFDLYPFGAGQGRWGMMNSYFGKPDTLWVEIQWTAWLYDGGVPLMICYFGAIVAAIIQSIRTSVIAAKRSDDWLLGWGALISAYNLSTIALTFSYVPFIGQAGLEFWMLNGLLFALARHRQRHQMKSSI
jgi:hypothetical protein